MICVVSTERCGRMFWCSPPKVSFTNVFLSHLPGSPLLHTSTVSVADLRSACAPPKKSFFCSLADCMYVKQVKLQTAESLKSDRGFVQPPVALPLANVFYGLFHRRTCEINAKDL